MSIRDDYTDDEWNKLTEEEQKGLLLMDADDDDEEGEDGDIDGDGDDDGDMSDADRLAANDRKAAALAEQQKQEAGEGDGAGEGDADDAGEEGKEGKEGEAGEGEGDDAGSAGDDGLASGASVPLPKDYNAELPEDYSEKVKANEEAQTANEKSYDDGDISFAEFRKEQRRLDKESRDLDNLKNNVERDRKIARESVINQWQGLMNAFIPSHPELNASQVRMNVFDQILQRVTGETMKKGNMPGMAEVNTAYREWCKEFNVEASDTTDTAGKAKGKAAAAKPKKKNKVPPTLGGLPAAQGNDAADGRFAQLDRLTGDAYEDAFAKLSAADREAYLQGAG